MSGIIRCRSRICSLISNSNRRFSTAEPPKEPIISASTVLNDQPPPQQPPNASSSPPPAAGAEKKSWSFLKYGLLAAVTGGVATAGYATYGANYLLPSVAVMPQLVTQPTYELLVAVTDVLSTAGYATYAYTLDEVDEKTKALRASANYTVGDDASGFEKFQALLSSAAMTVPAKLVELYLDLRRMAEDHVRGFTEPSSEKLLPDLHPLEQHVFTIVLDLNETLIYSDWKRDRGWRTFKRPGVDAFLEQLAQFYEIVVYSDQLNMYVDPVVDRLDPKHCIRYRLSRAATRYVDGKHYRDLSMLNRDPKKVIYISAHALESSLQKENCVEIKPYKGEAEDTALLDLIPFLEFVAKARPADIRTVLASYQGHDIPKEFIERSKQHQRRIQEQKQKGGFWRR